MDPGLLRILSSTTPRPTQLAKLCGLHAQGTIESALPTAAPYEGWKLLDSVVDVRTLTTTDHLVLTTSISFVPSTLVPLVPLFIPERIGTRSP